VVHYFDVVVVEDGCASVVTQLSNGKERMCELGKDVCLLCLLRQEGNVDEACVRGLDFSFVGELDVYIPWSVGVRSVHGLSMWRKWPMQPVSVMA